jgi:radical SAM-linked protein
MTGQVSGSRPGRATPAPPPVVQRLMVRYAKRGRMRFASHRDIARAVERGVRRAGLPIAYSAGFSPHPKISYAGGAPTGTASEAEYLEISLTSVCAVPDVRQRLDAALPDGIDVIEVQELSGKPGGDSALRLEGSLWRLVLPGITPGDAARAVQAFLAAPSVMVERLTTKGVRRLDARAAVVALELDQRAMLEQDAGCAILRMVVRHLTPVVRPDDILAALGIMHSTDESTVRGTDHNTVQDTDDSTVHSTDDSTVRKADNGTVQGTDDDTGSGALPGAETSLPLSSPPLVTRLAQGPLAGPAGWITAQEPEQETRHEVLARAATGSAATATATAGAYEPLPRGADGPGSGLRAREDDGRLPGCSTPSVTTVNQPTRNRVTVTPRA